MLRRLYRVSARLVYELRMARRLKKPLGPILPFMGLYCKFNLMQNIDRLSLSLPWITFASLRFLDGILHPNMKAFEYGSGGSTLYLAKRIQELVSVEHAQEWYANVQTKLAAQGLKNVANHFITPDSIPNASYLSSYGPKEVGQSFEKYVKSIEAYPEEHFDLIIIDGRARSACIRHAWPKLKTGGYLLFDNADRSGYQKALSALQAYAVHRSYGPTVASLAFTETHIYQKKGEKS